MRQGKFGHYFDFHKGYRANASNLSLPTPSPSRREGNQKNAEFCTAFGGTKLRKKKFFSPFPLLFSGKGAGGWAVAGQRILKLDTFALLCPPSPGLATLLM